MSGARPRCYVASPLGFTAPGRDWYARVCLPALATVVDPVDPWALSDSDEVARANRAGAAAQAALCEVIGTRNTAALRGCELLVALLDGQEIDSGTAAELGYGAALGLTCFGLRTDLREIGEPGARVNLQVQAFVRASGGTIAPTLDELVERLGARA